jgi:plasmid stabilization system protein ParE
MANKKYKIRYLPTFISQLNNILYYITYELKNKIAADNFYNEVVKQIEVRSNAPESYEVFKTIKGEKIKYYKIYVKNYTIFYVVKNNVMEIRRIYYSQRNFDNLI